MPKHARPVTHRKSRSIVRSPRGRGVTVGDGDMGTHRTEMLQNRDGHLVVVDYFGLFDHEGTVRETILQLKYEAKRSNAAVLATFAMDALPPVREPMHFVTWAPTTSRRHIERGFDQSELIARHFAAQMKVKHSRLLRRVNDGSQTGSGRNERLVRPEFVARPNVCGKNILVVDDVMTTGATMRAASEALVHAGASYVMCLCISWVQ